MLTPYRLCTSLALLWACSLSCLAAQLEAPTIYVQPQSRTVTPGTRVTFSVDAGGFPTPAYFWRKDGVVMGTGPTYVVAFAQPSNAGIYDLVLTNVAGSVTSAPAILTVNFQGPGINTEPRSQYTCLGRSAALIALVGGVAPIQYWWQMEGTNLLGAEGILYQASNATARLDIPIVAPEHGGDYRLVVSNAMGVVTSAVASVVVNPEWPVILVHPQSRVVFSGVSLLLSNAAFSCSSLLYQWRFNGESMPGATGPSLNLSPTSFDKTGDYDVVVANAAGSVTSRVAHVLVTNSPPTLLCEPRSQTVYAGSNAMFSVCATGRMPIHYRWYFNDSPLAIGGTNFASSNLFIWNVNSTHAGAYSVVVSNADGVVTSAVATLTVLTEAPMIYQQPQSLTVFAGETATFSVNVFAAPPPVFHWRRNGLPLVSGYYPTLNLASVSASQAGDYTVVVSNYVGAVTSEVATLTVALSVPVFTTQPESRTAYAGETITFTAAATGVPAPQYQWLRDGQVIGSGPELPLYGVTAAQSGDYVVRAYNPSGSVTSQVARLTVLETAPVIQVQPQNRTVSVGSNATFSVGAVGVQPLSYQWQRNGTAIPGAVSSILTFTVNSPADAGSYRVVVANSLGATTSAVATLTVIVSPPNIVVEPEDKTVDYGASTYFFVSAGGSPPLAYQWRRNGIDLPSGTVATLWLSGVTTNDAGAYSVVVSNAGGAATSRVARLTVAVRPPVIIQGPVSRGIFYGQSATLSADTTGAPIPTLHWVHDGVPVPGNSQQLYIEYATEQDAGDYWVIASNFVGSATSEVARITVATMAPQISAPPQSITVDAGNTAYFSVGAFAAPPPAYQWRVNGIDIPYANSSWLYIYDSSTDDEGDYTVVITNILGAVTSTVARLSVRYQPPSIIAGPTSTIVDAGAEAYFYISYIGSPPFTFEWQRDGIPVPQGTNAVLSLPNVSSNDQGAYRVIIRNPVGTAVSPAASLTVRYSAPVIVNQPRSQSVYAGNYVSFNVYVQGGPSPALQWFFNGDPLPGETGSTLAFYANSTNQAGNYYVVASNYLGVAVSATVQLTVLFVRPYFTTQPLSQGVVAGGELELFAAASGQPYPQMQWQLNGRDIPGATYSWSYYVHSATTNDAGDYTVVASNAGGSVTSQVARVEVLLPGPLDRWSWRNPLPQGNDLRDAAYGNGAFVAVGREGARVRSTDGGQTWRCVSSGAEDLERLAFGNGLFVAISDTWGVVSTSPDGWHWVDREIETLTGTWLADIAFGNGRFVAIGYACAAVSTDGIAWTTVPLPSGYDWYQIAFGNRTFVANANRYEPEYGGYHTYSMVSSNGLTWSALGPRQLGYMSDFTAGAGRFAGLNSAQAFVSQDGLTWTSEPLGFGGGTPRDMAFGAGTYVASTEWPHLLLSSRDGGSWTPQTHWPSNELFGVGFGPGRFVAVGNYGNILVSSNAQDWAARSSASDLNVRAVAWGNGRYVAVGNEGLTFTSTDGLAWTRSTAPTTNNLRSVAFGNGRFVAVGELAGSTPTLLASHDGVTWARPTLYTFASFYSVIYRQGLFVAVGTGGTVLTSPDGLNWSVHYASAYGRFNSVTYGQGRFIAVGQSTTIATSTNGTNWFISRPPAEDGGFLQGVAYGNGLFVAAGQSGLLLTSSNALDWTAHQRANYRDIEDMIFADGRFIAVGERGFVASSTDGTTWTRHRTGCQNDLRGVIYADSRLLAVGNNETIIQSEFHGPPIVRVQNLIAAEGFEFSVEAEVGRTYRLQGSDNLLDWYDIFNFSNTQETTVFLDEDAPFQPARFFRVISP